MIGWIKIQRAIQEHWIFSDAEKFRAWTIILLRVNYEKKTELIEGELITCNRGQSTLSLKSWASIFGKNWTIQKVRTFFKLLEKDKMVRIEGLRKTTRLTVCNYDSYQDEQHRNNTQITHKQQRDNKEITTIKEVKENKETKNYIYSKFYDNELNNSDNNNSYLTFIKFIYGENDLNTKFNGILSIEQQLSFEQFNKIIEVTKANKLKLRDLLAKMENDKKYYKGKKSLYLTLNNWAKGKFV